MNTEPINIILGACKNKTVMQYALQNTTNQVFVSRYQRGLPDRVQLESAFRRSMSENTRIEIIDTQLI